jgi:hypothetical protein
MLKQVQHDSVLDFQSLCGATGFIKPRGKCGSCVVPQSGDFCIAISQ